jgi:hypothetical protein
MTVKKPLELVAALALFCGALFMLSQTTNLHSTADVGLGASFFPRILFSTIAVLSLVMLKGTIAWGKKAGGLLQKKKKDPDDATAMQWSYIGILFVYILVMRYIGYAISTFALCFIVMTMLGPKTPKAICVNAVLSAATAGLLVYVFGTLLSLFLP